MENKNKFELLSLSSDLGRIAVSIHRNSFEVAARFCDEGLRYCKAESTFPEYIQNILLSLQEELTSKRLGQVDAERYLVRSIQIQNFAIKHL
jgi:hypothetical protein